MKRSAGDIFAMLFIVAAIYVLVRPRSRAGELVSAVFRAANAMVRKAADLAA